MKEARLHLTISDEERGGVGTIEIGLFSANQAKTSLNYPPCKHCI